MDIATSDRRLLAISAHPDDVPHVKADLLQVGHNHLGFLLGKNYRRVDIGCMDVEAWHLEAVDDVGRVQAQADSRPALHPKQVRCKAAHVRLLRYESIVRTPGSAIRTC